MTDLTAPTATTTTATTTTATTATAATATAAAPGPARRGVVLAALLAPVLAACSGGSSGGTAGSAPGTAAAVSAEPAAATTGATGATPAPTSPGARASGVTVSASASDHAGAPGGAGGAGADPSGTATVGLVPGFPTTVIPVVPGATVTASAVRRKGDRLEISLSGAVSRTSQATVLAFYDKTFRSRGFTAAGGSTLAPGTGGRIYARGDEVVVVAANTRGKVVSFSVGGTVRP